MEVWGCRWRHWRHKVVLWPWVRANMDTMQYYAWEPWKTWAHVVLWLGVQADAGDQFLIFQATQMKFLAWAGVTNWTSDRSHTTSSYNLEWIVGTYCSICRITFLTSTIPFFKSTTYKSKKVLPEQLYINVIHSKLPWPFEDSIGFSWVLTINFNFNIHLY